MRRLGSAAVGVIVFVAAHGAAGPPCCAAPAVAGASRQAAEAYRLTVGDAQVVSFSDCTIPIDLHKTLSGITRSELDALLAAAFASNPMETSVNVFLIRWAGRTVLVDTGLGDPSRADCGRIFEGLAAVGIRPSQIDDVLITHLHLDHVGGLLRNGAMTFPNATIHISKPELDSYLYPTAGQDVRAHDLSRLIVSIVKPYLDAGRIKTFA